MGDEGSGDTHRSWAGYLREHPAIVVTLLVAAGIALGDVVPARPGLWLCGAAGLLTIAALIGRRPAIATGLIAGGILLTGLAAAQIDRFAYPANSIANYTTEADRFAEVEVAIEQSPRLVVPGTGELRALPPKQVMEARVRAIRTRAGWSATSGEILLTLEEPNPRLGAGQVVRATGMLERPATPTNPGEFDGAAYWREQRVLGAVRVSHANGVEILEEPGPGALLWMREKTRHLLARGFPAERAFDHALLRALVLGDSDPQLRDVQDEFIRTGLVHQLSISGLHVAIIGGVVMLICRLLRFSPRTSILASLGVVTLYAMVALPSWPGWRSVIMCAVAATGLLGRRSVDGAQLLAIAVAIILLIHPADLHNAGFQISFAAVLGLMIFSNGARTDLWNWWQGPDAIAQRPVQRGIVSAGARRVGRFIFGSLVAGFAAWVASMPLVAYRYGQLNTWSVPASVALLPLTVVALIGGVLKILLTLGWPSGAGLWATAAGWPIVLMQKAIGAIDRIPGVSLPLVAPSIGFLVAYYCLLLAGIFRPRRAALAWLCRVSPILACAGFVIWSIPGRPVATGSPDHELRITLINLGAGQCAVVRPEANRAVLIDAGSSTISDVGRHLIAPYLREEGCTEIDKILLSHGDFDHISATSDLFQTFREPAVYMSPHFERNAVGNVVAESLLEMLRETQRPPRIIHRGDHLELGDGAGVDVLWPPVDCNMNSNNCGLVLKLHFGGKTVLFPADIQEPAERELLKDPGQLKSDILVAPHHGSAELTTGEFVRAVHPEYILASNARRLTHKQKTFDMQEAGYPIYRTSREGAITVTINEHGIVSISTYLNPVAPSLAAMAK